MTPDVVHNAAMRRFELATENGTVVAEYDLSPGAIAFTHTLTPPALRGQGLAAKVVKAALDHARSEKLRVIPMCWYVAQYIDQHPEYRPLLVR